MEENISQREREGERETASGVQGGQEGGRWDKGGGRWRKGWAGEKGEGE